MIEILICDDNYNHIKTTEKIVQDSLSASSFSDLEYRISFTISPMDLMENNTFIPDILILDIHMPEITGLEIAESFFNKGLQTKIIFLTSYEQFVFYSLRFSPFRFVRKSAMKKELPEAVESAIKSILVKTTSLTIKHYSDYQIIPVNSIKYIEKLKSKNSVQIVCNNETIVSRETISVLEKKLEGNGFVKINSGTLVNLQYIKQISGLDVMLIDKQLLRISQTKSDIVKKEFAKYMRYSK